MVISATRQIAAVLATRHIQYGLDPQSYGTAVTVVLEDYPISEVT